MDEFSSSGNDEDTNSDDLSLEKTADAALSDWYGISLSRLTRPIRVIYAFKDVKERCASIIQDEGLDFDDADEGSDTFEPLDGEQDSNLQQGERSSNTTPTHHSTNGLNNKKRPNDEADNAKSNSSCQPVSRVRGPNKKRRIPVDMSCPYRKRNPRRFNVRDHEDCANRSYKDMTALK